jgi:hypothetical protein
VRRCHLNGLTKLILYCTTIKPYRYENYYFFIPQTLTFNSCRTITPFDRLLWLYQNSSYYDTDGIYGNTYSRNIETNTQNNQNQYKEYFGSLRDDNQTPEVFTDIDNYNDYNLDNDQENYPGWEATRKA